MTHLCIRQLRRRPSGAPSYYRACRNCVDPLYGKHGCSRSFQATLQGIGPSCEQGSYRYHSFLVREAIPSYTVFFCTPRVLVYMQFQGTEVRSCLGHTSEKHSVMDGSPECLNPAPSMFRISNLSIVRMAKHKQKMTDSPPCTSLHIVEDQLEQLLKQHP